MRRLLITVVGAAGMTLVLVGVAWGQSILYGAASVPPPAVNEGAASLYTINPSTGAATRVGPILFDNVDGIAFHPVTGTLYGVGHRRSDNVPVLLTIDPANGAGRVVRPITDPTGGTTFNFCSVSGTACQVAPDDIAFRSDGVLFALFSAHLATIDPTTGVATLVRAFAVNGFALNLAFSPSDVLTLIDAELFLVSLDPATGNTIDTVDLNFAFSGSWFYALAFRPDGGLFGTRNLSCCVSTDLELVLFGAGIIGPTVDGLEALAWSPTANTPSGANIVVQAGPVTLTFDNVTQAGTTTATASTTGPALPASFRLGDPPTYFDINTTAVFSDSVQVCINYAGIAFTTEALLRLLHFPTILGSTDVTTSLDTSSDVICGRVTSLSPFAIVEPEANLSLVANAGPDQAVRPGRRVRLDGSASIDPDNGSRPLSFQWTQAAGRRVRLTDATTATPTFKPRGPGVYMFTLVVHDGDVASTPDQVTITVTRSHHHDAGDDDHDRGDHDNDDGEDHDEDPDPDDDN
jgi:hypothetical protein